MDTGTAIAILLIIGVFALVAVAAFAIYRNRAKVSIKGPLGTGLDIDGSNQPPAAPPQPGVRMEGVTSTAGKVSAKDQTGKGVDMKQVRAKQDITATSTPPPESKAQNGEPKPDPKA